MNSVYAGEISTSYQVNVLVNGKRLKFTGSGYGRDPTGEVGVDVATLEDCPKGFHPALLAFTLITGQADIGRRLDGVSNPFQQKLGAYKARRTLNLDCGRGSLKTAYQFTPIDGAGKREAIFNIEGEVDVPEIIGIRPAFETWVPDGPGQLRGHFTMAWVAGNGTHFKGEVDTHYELPGISLAEPLYRRIEFKIEGAGNRLIQHERIIVFPESAGIASAA